MNSLPPDENRTVPAQPDANKRRSLYDYSRSSGSDGHWYSGGAGGTNPLNHTSEQRKTPSLTYRQTRTRDRVERRQRTKRGDRPDNLAWIVISVALLGMTLITTMILIFVMRNDKDNRGVAAANNLVEPTSIFYEGTPENAAQGVLDGNSMLIKPWDGEERFTVMLMGLDQRPDEPDGLCRTDTIMIVSLDPVNDRIGILSIPRDTYVQIPGYGEPHKINEACVLGNLELPGQGPRLAMQTIQLNFAIFVNDYIMVNFQAFTSIIDRVGGVDVYVEQEIDDPEYPDMFYGYDHFYIAAGLQHLDGETALKYARSRHASDDIDRGRRQQQVIFAVRDKVLTLGMVDDLVLQALPIWNDLKDGVQTGLSLDQLVQLALYARNIADQNIKSAVLDWSYLRAWDDPNGLAVLVPDRDKLPSLMLEIFGEGYNQQ